MDDPKRDIFRHFFAYRADGEGMAGFMSMFGENYSLCFCWRYAQEFGQMGIEYMAQIWKQFQPEIWQRLTPVYVSFAAEISFRGECFCLLCGKKCEFSHNIILWKNK